MSLSDKLLQSFPVPGFLDIPYAGLQIDDKFARFFYEDGKKQHFGEIEIPEGVMEKGFIEDKKTFVEILSKFREENNLQYVKISLPEKYSYAFSFFLRESKDLKKDEIEGEVSKRIPENIPLEKDSYYFDFEITNSKSQNCVVYVYQKNQIDNILSVLNICGFIIVSTEIETNSVSRSCVKESNNNPLAILYIKESESVFFIVNFGVPYITKTFDFGFKDFKKFIGQEKIVLYQPLSIIQDYIKEYIEKWKQNSFSKELDFNFNKMLICGNTEGLEIAPDYFSLNMDLDCQFANVWQNILDIEKELPSMDFSKSLKYVASIGLVVK